MKDITWPEERLRDFRIVDFVKAANALVHSAFGNVCFFKLGYYYLCILLTSYIQYTNIILSQPLGKTSHMGLRDNIMILRILQ